ncbi:MAG: TetR/AcrR family transcriptional regulator [Pseudonocardia sp.]|nr:TetR/AcrR family transcriptional regulator [Pseudonocardia sp.]
MSGTEPSRDPVPRRYRSPLRAERAADTRRRIATAARELFSVNGFAGTTVSAIADRAGVTPQTVYVAFGSKGAIVRALLTQFENDADGGHWHDRIAAEPDPHRKLAAFAHWSALLFSSSKAVIAAARGAAGDPAIVELREQGDQHRRLAVSALVSDLGRAGALSPDLTTDRAVDRAWMLTGVDLYLGATDGCGWSDTEYADWLAHLLQDQLLR